jgi:hypothetical protein
MLITQALSKPSKTSDFFSFLIYSLSNLLNKAIKRPVERFIFT